MSQLPPPEPQAMGSRGGRSRRSETSVGSADSRSHQSPLPLPPLMLAPALSAIGLALCLIFVLTVCSQLLPLRLLQPAWQLRASAVLLENGLWPLLGLGLLQLASYLEPTDWRLGERWERLGRLGVIAVLGFVLLMPLQIVATARTLHSLDSKQRSQQDQVESNLKLMRQQIQASTSLGDLQRRIRDIQAPDLLIDPASLNKPLPVLKRSFLASVDQSEQLLRRRFRAETVRGRSWALLQRTGRGVLLALVLAVAYAAATPCWAEPEESLLMLWQECLWMRKARR
jgi:hypothetical protein